MPSTMASTATINPNELSRGIQPFGWPAALKCVAMLPGNCSQTLPYRRATTASASHSSPIAICSPLRFMLWSSDTSSRFRRNIFGAEGIFVPRQFLPTPDVRNAFLVPGHHNFFPLADRTPVFAANSAYAPRPALRVDQLARSTFADGNADLAQHPNHLVVGGIHV